MNHFSKISPRIIPTIRLGLAGLMLSILLPTVALAQDEIEKRDSVTIKIERIDGVCTYDILGQDNDDKFIIGTDSPISFEAVGVTAWVEIGRANEKSRDSRDQSRPGVHKDHRASFDVSSEGPEHTRSRSGFKKRDNQPTGKGVRTTSHKVFISCKNEDGEEDENASKSLGQPENGGGGGTAVLITPGYNDELRSDEIRSGPSEIAIPLSVLSTPELIGLFQRGEGGPDMEVEDP